MELFRQMTEMSDEEIANIHPNHNIKSIKSLIPRLRYFQVNYHFAKAFMLTFWRTFYNTKHNVLIPKSSSLSMTQVFVLPGWNMHCSSPLW